MRISKEVYYKTMAKALLKGYFVGLEEGLRRNRKLKNNHKVDKCIFKV